MKRHELRPNGARPLGGLSIFVLALALAALALPVANGLAAYTFTGGGTNTGTAQGDAAVTTLWLEEFGGLIYHSTDGVVFSPDWGGGLTIPALATTTVNVNVSTGDGSVVMLGGVLSPASALQALIQTVAAANTADLVVIDDSTNAAAVTYVLDTLPGFITAPGINYNQSASAAFRGGVRLIGGSAGNTFNVLSMCCASTAIEPLDLIGGVGNDTFVVPLSPLNKPLRLISGGGGTDTIDMTGLPGPAGAARTVDLAGGTIAEVVTNFNGIEVFKGNGTNDILRGPDAANTWSITGITAGNLAGGPSFSGFPNIVGGTGTDAFTVAPSPTTTLTIDGGLPAAPPGDSLTVDLTGVTSPIVNNPGVPGAGQVTFGNRSPVDYTGIEALFPANLTPVIFPAPTLNEWGMVIMSVLLGGSCICLLRRRRSA
jgi:hypothetical protein